MYLSAQRFDLSKLARSNRLRRLASARGVDFSSNDYLGLAGSPRIAGALVQALAAGMTVGSGGSRLLRGNHPEHERLEAEAACFFGAEAALFFGSGYAANTALFAALPGADDLVVHDELVHASAHDGMRLGRAARVGASHNDPDAFADAIRAWREQGGRGTPWIAVESLYSMDGDRAPLAQLAEVADRFEAMLLIDEAHATGVWGEGGRGFAAMLEGLPNVVTLKTMGKALGGEGALVCGPAVVRDVLVTRGRPFIFSTAPSPLMAVAAREGLAILADEPERRERLHTLIDHAQAQLARFGITPSESQILPLVIGDDAETMRVASALQAAGFDVRGIRPPTVPSDTSRLRISLTLHVGEEEIAALAEALQDALR